MIPAVRPIIGQGAPQRRFGSTRADMLRVPPEYIHA